MSESGFDVAMFVGRFHPLLVHLPIGFLLLLTLLELLAFRAQFKHLRVASRVVLVVSVPACVLAAFTGWLLASDGGYNESLVFWHRWLGVGVAGLSVVLLAAHWQGWFVMYRSLLFLLAGMLAVTGHFGGSLTHGSNYLIEYAPSPLRRLLRGDDASVGDQGESPSAYGSLIRPMFSKFCVECHGAEKTKGGLRLDSYERLLIGGDNGAVIIPGNASESELLFRCQLPPDDDDHMPPDGKPQPAEDRIELLKWWVDSGASPTKSLAELNAPEAILESAARYRPASEAE